MTTTPGLAAHEAAEAALKNCAAEVGLAALRAKRDAALRLAESAPELLEALKLCAAVCAGETTTKAGLIHALEKARAALVKATGAAS